MLTEGNMLIFLLLDSNSDQLIDKMNRFTIHLVGTCLFLLYLANQSLAVTFYVTPAGAGTMDGSSWNDAGAGASLQLIIDGAQPGDQIWVACGTYLPGSSRIDAFSMRTDVEIYGGFQGSEQVIGDRVLSCGPCSILSGEIGAAGTADNCYNVVSNSQLDSTAILDGFVIRDGYDDRSPTNAGDGLGAGIYNHGFGPNGHCDPVIRNCIFTNNSASWGAGAFNNGYGQGDTEPTYINCIFYENHAFIEAGGMDSYGVGGNASPLVINTLFYENSSATNVGAMYAWGGNSGGNCHPMLVNCAFVNNHAMNGYGGAFIADNLDENGSTSSGSCTVTMQDCIVWNNTSSTATGHSFYVRGNGAQVLATYSDIDTIGQNGALAISGPGTGNVSTNPFFRDINDGIGPDACWMTADDGISLLSNSPCIDAGNNSGIWPTDLAGNLRIDGIRVDMGPYEYQNILAIWNPDKGNDLHISPNPTHGKVKVKAEQETLVDLRVFDMMGKEIQIEGKEESGRKLLDLSGLPAGIYYIHGNGNAGQVLKL